MRSSRKTWVAVAKRLADIAASTTLLVVLLPALILIALAISLDDRRWPFYVPVRIGRARQPFRMLKFRTMIVGADRTKVDSTASDDPRITRVGHALRQWKLDELPQLWNVVVGDMSLVGPRPNVARETASYTTEEMRLLDVRPGMTDLASIVFFDEGAILAGSTDPDIEYNQLIRPWKSRLSLLYVDAGTAIGLDARIVWLTILSLVARRRALEGVAGLVRALGATEELAAVARRTEPLRRAAPPGATQVVARRTFQPAT